MIGVALLALLALLAAVPLRAETLIVEASTETVSVTSNFVGTRVSLFGVIERDAMTVARRGKYQVIAVVRGPRHDVLVQRKERFLGIWVNGEGVRFADFPSYYGVFASASAAPLLAAGGAAYGLSLAALGASIGADDEFRGAVARDRAASGQFVEDIGGMIMMTDAFFRTEIPLPGIADVGRYEVEVFLYADAVLLDTRETAFVIAKAGVEQQLFDLSRAMPLVYGLAVVVLALVTGYVGGVLFRRG